ncbi:MAG: HD domain-containing protein [bacterium]|nr:HD domain-containing protein [bacterium]
MKKVFRILERLAENPHMEEMDRYIQHGDTSCLLHTVAVAYYSMKLAEKLRIPVHKRELIRGALLHDYFLYDWHDGKPERKIHGFTHPATAARNADRDFKLKRLEMDIIQRHMFPLTPKPPASREAWLVCLVDKGCSLYETFGRKNYRGIDEKWKKEFRKLYEELRDNVE